MGSIAKTKKVKKDTTFSRTDLPLCGDLKFAAAESYKLLRTNLMFSLPEKDGCKVIGVSSSLQGEGKSVTSVNLSYTFAQTGKRVLLIEADLRLPSISKYLKYKANTGLSNVLVGLSKIDDAVFKSGILENWSILDSGEIPPNPSELLSSEKMKKMLDELSKSFDFIVIDLPPVNIVTDALVVLNHIDGIVIVTRQNYVNRQALSTCMRQLEPQKNKVLGFVMTDSKDFGKKYGKYKKGSSYGEGYDKANG